MSRPIGNQPPKAWIDGELIQKLKRQFFSAGNWKKRIDKSNLPEPVIELILGVVRRSRLMRFEKYEIATDLIYHFQDGHERGRSYDDLIESFGDSAVASQLFRSSKLRNRPMSIKATKGILGIFGGSVVGFIALHFFYSAAVPTPKFDYSNQLNDTVTSVPEDEKAWPKYREIWIKYGLSEGGQYSDQELYVPDEKELDFTSNPRRLVKPSDPQWPAAVAKLDSIEEVLEMFRQHAHLPHLGTPLHIDLSRYSDEDFAALMPGKTRDHQEYDTPWGLEVDVSDDATRLINQSCVGILLPHIQKFRMFARTFVVDTRLAILQGDQERALSNIKTIFGLSRQVGNNPILVQKLVAIAIQSEGVQLVQSTLDAHPNFFSNERLESLQTFVANTDISYMTSPDLSFEISVAKDMIQRIYSDDGNGDGRMTPVGAEVLIMCQHLTFTSGEELPQSVPPIDRILGPMQLFSAPTRREVEAELVDLATALETEAKKRLWENQDFDFSEHARSKGPGELFESLGTILGTLQICRERMIAQRGTTTLGIAAHRFRRHHKRWPTALNELEGTWLKALPYDPATGDTIKFLSSGSGIRIYSVGFNNTDEGGIRNQVGWIDRENDWIFWPLNEEADLE